MKRFFLLTVLSSLLVAPQAAAADARPVSLRPGPTLNRQKGKVSAVVFSPDGKALAVGVEGGGTELWEASAGRLVAGLEGRILLPFYREEPGDVFGPDGRVLATMDGKEAKLWDASTGRLLHTLKGHAGEVRAFAFSPDGRLLATSGADGTVRLWETATGRLTNSLRAFELKSYSRLRFVSRGFEQKLAYASVSFSPDGRRLLTARHAQRPKLWDAATGQLIREVGGESAGEVSFSPDGRFILTRHATVPGSADLWEAETGRMKAALNLPAYDAAFSPDGRRLGLVSYLGDQGLLNLETMEVDVPLRLTVTNASRTLFSPDGRTFVLGAGWERETTVVEVPSGKVVSTLPLAAERGFDFVSDYLKHVESLSFHPRGRVLLGASRKHVRLWDAATGAQLALLAEARAPAAFSRDGRTLAAASAGQKHVRLWSVED